MIYNEKKIRLLFLYCDELEPCIYHFGQRIMRPFSRDEKEKIE